MILLATVGQPLFVVSAGAPDGGLLKATNPPVDCGGCNYHAVCHRRFATLKQDGVRYDRGGYSLTCWITFPHHGSKHLIAE